MRPARRGPPPRRSKRARTTCRAGHGFLGWAGRGRAYQAGPGLARQTGPELPRRAGRGLAGQAVSGLARQTGPGLPRRAGRGPARQTGPGLARWAGRAQRGSISVELAILAPGLALLLLLVAAGARVVEVQGHIDGAARDAARAASIARSFTQAVTAAQQAAQADLGTTSLCTPNTVGVRVAGYPAVPLTAAPGAVTVTVTCQVNMSPFKALGFGVTKTFTGQAVAPLDPFMCRDVAC